MHIYLGECKISAGGPAERMDMHKNQKTKRAIEKQLLRIGIDPELAPVLAATTKYFQKKALNDGNALRSLNAEVSKLREDFKKFARK
jgi:hypothetical protein